MGNDPANQIDPDGMIAGPSYDRVVDVDAGSGEPTPAASSNSGLIQSLQEESGFDVAAGQGIGSQTTALENALNYFNSQASESNPAANVSNTLAANAAARNFAGRGSVGDGSSSGLGPIYAGGGDGVGKAFGDVARGFIGGAQTTYNTFTSFSGWVGLLIGGPVDIKAGWGAVKNANSSDYAYGIGFGIEKVAEIFILRKISGAVTPKPKLTSSQLGRVIGWGEGQSEIAMQQTQNLTENLTRSQVKQFAKQGLKKIGFKNS